MNLKESIAYHCQQLVNETEDRKDAMEYIDDVVSDVMEEHPNADEDEVEELVREELET